MVRIRYKGSAPEKDWRDIPGFHRYEINALGEVRNKARGSIMALNYSNGTWGVSLLKDGKGKARKSVMQLMIAAFGIDTKGLVPVHINGVKTESSIFNIGLVPLSVRCDTRVRRRSVVEYDARGNILRIYGTVTEAARENGISSSWMCNLLSRKDGYHLHGKRFEYEEREH